MPCGGGDIGMNVWVEQGELLVIFFGCGSFDENSCFLKSGRIRLSFPGTSHWIVRFCAMSQAESGLGQFTGGSKGQRVDIDIWADCI
jgi:hypothetical protein